MSTRDRCLALLAALAATIAPGPAEALSVHAAQLKWNFVPDPEASAGRCRLDSVSGVNEAGKELWKRRMPARLRGKTCSCEDGRAAPFAALSALGAGATEHGTSLVLVTDVAGVLALDRATGKVLLDRSLSPGKHPLAVMRGTFSLSGEPPCMGIVRAGGTVTQCGREVLVLRGGRALLLGIEPFRVLAEGSWDGKGDLGPDRVSAVMKIGKRELTVNGVTQMR